MARLISGLLASILTTNSSVLWLSMLNIVFSVTTGWSTTSYGFMGWTRAPGTTARAFLPLTMFGRGFATVYLAPLCAGSSFGIATGAGFAAALVGLAAFGAGV